MKQLIWKSKTIKQLSFNQKYKKAGRNSTGCITMFHRGGGSKRLIRKLDLKRNLLSTGFVERIEYDPNRTARIALVNWSSTFKCSLPNEKRSGGEAQRTIGHKLEQKEQRSVQELRGSYFICSYILACDHLKVGDKIINLHTNSADYEAPSSTTISDSIQPFDALHNTRLQKAVGLATIVKDELLNEKLALRSASQIYQQIGACIPLYDIPIGTYIHNIEMRPGEGGKYVRAAGTFAQLVQKLHKSRETAHALRFSSRPVSSKRSASQCVVRLPSGILQKLDSECRATIGIVSNVSHNAHKLRKAGQKRWLGIRPVVRGVAMNPIDHPHGGGEGRTKGGRPSVSPWGKPSKGGYKTVIRKKNIYKR